MGSRREHLCPRCSYKAVVTGGPDVGMSRVYTLTIACIDCQELYDVDWLEPRQDVNVDASAPVQWTWKQSRLRCPENSAHEWEPFMGQCPVCRTMLEINEEGESYDWD